MHLSLLIWRCYRSVAWASVLRGPAVVLQVGGRMPMMRLLVLGVFRHVCDPLEVGGTWGTEAGLMYAMLERRLQYPTLETPL
jgi:hypothetical protein